MQRDLLVRRLEADGAPPILGTKQAGVLREAQAELTTKVPAAIGITIPPSVLALLLSVFLAVLALPGNHPLDDLFPVRLVADSLTGFRAFLALRSAPITRGVVHIELLPRLSLTTFPTLLHPGIVKVGCDSKAPASRRALS